MKYVGYANGKPVTGEVSQSDRDEMQANPAYKFITWVPVEKPEPAKLSDDVAKSVRKAKRRKADDKQE